MVTQKFDDLQAYREVKQRNDDKFEEEKLTHELKDNFIERQEVRVLLVSIMNAIGEDTNYWINIDDRWRNFTDKFEQGAIVSMRIRTEDVEEAESIRGKIQQVFHKPAIREVNGYDGTVYYKFEVTFARKEWHEEHLPEYDGVTRDVPGTVSILITNASLAESCEVVKVTEEVTHYEIVCSDGTKEVIDG